MEYRASCLGILAGDNKEMIAKLKKDVSIWNINSFGEFYLQIYEKYAKDYKAAMDKFRQERRAFVNALAEVRGLRVTLLRPIICSVN